MLVLINTTTWRVDKLPKDRCWYEYNNTDAPILYSLYVQVTTERDLILKAPYTAFQKEDGSAFISDVELTNYLDRVLGNNDISTLGDSGQVDAGGRLRVSQITSQLDIKQINDNAPLYYNRVNIGSATQVYTKALGGVTMAVTTTSDAAIAQTKMFANYFSGKSQFGEITFSKITNQANVTKRAGYFSATTTTPHDANKDGLWFEADGTDYRFRIQKNGTDILNVAQSDWNINTFETFDGSKFNVLVFQFLYLGGTAVRFGFIKNGGILWCHQYTHAGLVASTFVESPNQPVRYEIRSTGGAGTFEQICAQVGSEGSVDDVGVHRHVSNGAVTCTSSGTEYAMLGIRLKSAYRNIRLDLKDVALIATTNDNYKWRILLNPTVAGTFTYSDVTNASIQFAAGATANTVTAASSELVIAEGFGSGNASIVGDLDSAIRLGSTIAGVSDRIVVTVTGFSNQLIMHTTLGIQEYL